MAKKNYKSRKKRKGGKKYSADQRRAYWIGVGIAAQKFGEGKNMEDGPFSSHIKAGKADFLGIKNAGFQFLK